MVNFQFSELLGSWIIDLFGLYFLSFPPRPLAISLNGLFPSQKLWNATCLLFCSINLRVSLGAHPFFLHKAPAALPIWLLRQWINILHWIPILQMRRLSLSKMPGLVDCQVVPSTLCSELTLGFKHRDLEVISSRGWEWGGLGKCGERWGRENMGNL